MAKFYHSRRGYTLCSVLLAVLHLCASDKCVNKSPCKCEFSDGTGIDLSNSVGKRHYNSSSFIRSDDQSSYFLKQFFYHPCQDEIPEIEPKAINNTCTKPLALCIHSIHMTKGTISEDEYLAFAKNDAAVFSDDGLSIIYKVEPSYVIVNLVCAKTNDNFLQVSSMYMPNNMTLTYFSPDACIRSLEEISERSFGSNLLVIFFSLLIVYIVLGVLTKKFLMGAQGIEVIPNLTFWMDLPNLVKDGWNFVRNGFQVPSDHNFGHSPNPDSYNSI